MSIQAIDWVLTHERTTTGTDRVVLIALANYADEAGECWPSIARLARDANIGERNVRYVLDRLVAAGLVERVRQGATNGRIRPDRRPNLYRLTLSTTHRDGVQPSAPRDVDGVQQPSERGATAFRHGVQAPAPKPSIEPSKNRARRRSFLPGTGWVEEAS